jgi:hypothetical protein
MEALYIIIGIAIVAIIINYIVKNGSSDSPADEERHSTRHSAKIESIGEHGENLVARFLSDDRDSIVLSDIILVDGKTQKSSQIDHVVIRPNGVFVVETKNYAGRIYGSESQQEWTQVLAYGETKNSFYNPIKQNSTHIYFLAKALRQQDIFISVIVFPRAELYVKTSTLVCDGKKSLLQALDSDTGISLSDNQMQNIANKLTEIMENSTITKEEHVENIFQMQQDIANNICPRCGRRLVLRNGRNGQFYGCKGYPKCHFTKRIND